MNKLLSVFVLVAGFSAQASEPQVGLPPTVSYETKALITDIASDEGFPTATVAVTYQPECGDHFLRLEQTPHSVGGVVRKISVAVMVLHNPAVRCVARPVHRTLTFTVDTMHGPVAVVPDHTPDRPSLTCKKADVQDSTLYVRFFNNGESPYVHLFVPNGETGGQILSGPCETVPGSIEANLVCHIPTSDDSGYTIKLFSIGGAKLTAVVQQSSRNARYAAITLPCGL